MSFLLLLGRDPPCHSTLPNSLLPQLSTAARRLSNMPTLSSQLDIRLQTANDTTVPIVVYHRRYLCSAIISERIAYTS